MQPPAARRFAFRVLACGRKWRCRAAFFRAALFPVFRSSPSLFLQKSAMCLRIPFQGVHNAAALRMLPFHSRAQAHGRHLPGDDEERKTVKEKGFPP